VVTRNNVPSLRGHTHTHTHTIMDTCPYLAGLEVVDDQDVGQGHGLREVPVKQPHTHTQIVHTQMYKRAQRRRQ
jgi:hypothetical protein